MFLTWMQLRALLAPEGVDGGGSGGGDGVGAGDGGNPDGAAGAGAGGDAGAAGAAAEPGFKVAVDGAAPSGAPADQAADKPADGAPEKGADEGVKDGEGDKKEGDEEKPEEFPHKPEDYKFTLPDGAEPDEAQAGEFAAFMVENQIAPDMAQKLVDFYAKTLQDKIIQPWVDQVNAWGEATKNDKEYGGAAYDENIAIANRALAEFGTPELGAAAREHGWGNHPEWVRAWVRIGKAMGAPRTEKGGESGNPGSGIPLKDALYS